MNLRNRETELRQRKEDMSVDPHFPLAILDSDFRILDCSDSFSKILKMEPAICRTKSLSGILGSAWTVNRERLQQAVDSAKPWSIHMDLSNSGEHEQWFGIQLMLQYFPIEKRMICLLSPRQQGESENSFSEALSRASNLVRDSAGDFAFITTDCNGIITSFSKGAENLFGYSGAKIMSRHIGSLFLPKDLIELPGKMVELKMGLNGFINETVLVRYDKTTFPAILAIYPIMGEDEEVENFFIIARDISKRKRAEQKLARSTTELRRRNKDLEDFQFAVSHDLQVPLRNLTYCSEMLLKSFTGRVEGEDLKNLETIVRSSKRMRSMLQDLVDYVGVIEKGSTRIAINMKDLLAQLMRDDFSQLVKMVNPEIEIADNMPDILANHTQIQQLYSNLIDNAFKFRAPNRRLHLRFTYKQKGRSHLFSVEDNGLGIAERDQKEIFGLFQRGAQRDTDTGNGIGLAICRQIVECHGGTITVESQEGVGSRFSFSISNMR